MLLLVRDNQQELDTFDALAGAHELLAAVADGQNRTFAWMDSMYSVDQAGQGVNLTPNGELDLQVSTALGEPGWVISRGLGLVLFADGAHDLFMVGSLASTRQGVGRLHNFVAKLRE